MMTSSCAVRVEEAVLAELEQICLAKRSVTGVQRTKSHVVKTSPPKILTLNPPAQDFWRAASCRSLAFRACRGPEGAPHSCEPNFSKRVHMVGVSENRGTSLGPYVKRILLFGGVLFSETPWCVGWQAVRDLGAGDESECQHFGGSDWHRLPVQAPSKIHKQCQGSCHNNVPGRHSSTTSGLVTHFTLSRAAQEIHSG